MHNGKEHSPLNIECKFAVDEQPVDGFSQPQFLPQPFEYQGRSDLDGMCCDIDLAGENKQRLFRESCQRPDKSFNSSFGLELVKTADSGDYPLSDFAFDLAVFDKLQVLIPAGFFYSGKHRVLLC